VKCEKAAQACPRRLKKLLLLVKCIKNSLGRLQTCVVKFTDWFTLGDISPTPEGPDEIVFGVNDDISVAVF
jgi:hypothetical protein